MATVTENAEHFDGTLKKAAETLPESVPVGPLIEEKELDGWNFVKATTDHGFTTLFFTKVLS